MKEIAELSMERKETHKRKIVFAENAEDTKKHRSDTRVCVMKKEDQLSIPVSSKHTITHLPRLVVDHGPERSRDLLFGSQPDTCFDFLDLLERKYCITTSRNLFIPNSVYNVYYSMGLELEKLFDCDISKMTLSEYSHRRCKVNITELLLEQNNNFLQHFKYTTCLKEIAFKEFMKVYIPNGLRLIFGSEDIESDVLYGKIANSYGSHVDLLYLCIKSVAEVSSRGTHILVMEEKRLEHFEPKILSMTEMDYAVLAMTNVARSLLDENHKTLVPTDVRMENGRIKTIKKYMNITERTIKDAWNEAFLDHDEQMEVVERYNGKRGSQFSALWEIGSDITTV